MCRLPRYRDFDDFDFIAVDFDSVDFYAFDVGGVCRGVADYIYSPILAAILSSSTGVSPRSGSVQRPA